VRVIASAALEIIPLEESLRYRNRCDPSLDLSTGVLFARRADVDNASKDNDDSDGARRVDV